MTNLSVKVKNLFKLSSMSLILILLISSSVQLFESADTSFPFSSFSSLAVKKEKRRLLEHNEVVLEGANLDCGDAIEIAASSEMTQAYSLYVRDIALLSTVQRTICSDAFLTTLPGSGNDRYIQLASYSSETHALAAAEKLNSEDVYAAITVSDIVFLENRIMVLNSKLVDISTEFRPQKSINSIEENTGLSEHTMPPDSSAIEGEIEKLHMLIYTP